MEKYQLLASEKRLVEEDKGHILTKLMELFRGVDLNKLYETKKADLISKFSQQQLKGPGWVLSKIIKLQILITDCRPLSNVNAKPEAALTFNDDDWGGSIVFDIGDYWQNKKSIIVPQNKNDPYCFLWANTIAKFKPETHARAYN